MKIKIFIVFLFMVVSVGLSGALFTIENYTGRDIRVELKLNRSWGSASKIVPIAYGSAYKFDTGVYGVLPGGITWDEGRCFVDEFSIKPLSTGLIMRLFQKRYEYMYRSYLDYVKNGGYPQGEGPVSYAY